MKSEQVKLKVVHAEENAKLVSQIADLQAEKARQEARHLKEVADLEHRMYQTMLNDNENQADLLATKHDSKAYIQQWLDQTDLKHTSHFNPHAKPFYQEPMTQQLPQSRLEQVHMKQQSIDLWIDELIIGQETTPVFLDAHENLSHTLIKLESERDLPKIVLPVFNGEALTWPRFVEQFYVQIHCRPAITDTRRMDILQSHVDGEAKRLIQGLGYSGRNYALALKELKASFGHRIKVCRAFIDSVASGAQVPSHDPSALRRLYVAVRDCIATLQQLNYLSDLNSSDIVLKVSRRLPIDKVTRWNEFVRNIVSFRDPNLTDLQNWLRDRVEADFNPYAIPILSEPSREDTNKRRKNDTRHTKPQEKRIVRKQSTKPPTIIDNVDTTPKQAKAPCALCASDLDARRIHLKEAWAVDTNAFDCLPQRISDEWEHLKDLQLPDIEPTQVNMLIGVDVPEAHLQLDMIRGLENQPVAVKTLLGWTVMGIAHSDDELYHETQARINLTIARDQHLSDQLEDFWKTESFGISHNKTKPYSTEDEKAQYILERTTQLIEGHYQIGMLWRDKSPLPNNLKAAQRRLKILTKRIVRDPEFGVLYSKTLNDYVSKDQAEKLLAQEIDNSSCRTWYLPHHGVMNPNKPGKVRVVFDAATSYLGTSLNDKLMTGPDLVNSLFGILQRFRLFEVAIAADIEGMYHQVGVPKEDSEALRFLWKSDLKTPGPQDEYRMKVHVFGAADSSSCANYAVKRTAKDNADLFEQSVIDTALNDFYVDDLLKSVETTAVHLIQDITYFMKMGGFHLHKWISNSEVVMKSIPESERAVSSKNLDLNEISTIRALGLKWNIVSDTFVFDPRIHNSARTKRGVISMVSSIFDPCGYLAPYTVRAKCLIQDLWKLGLDWDDDLPLEIQSRWNGWLEEIQDLSSFNLCRHHQGFSSQSSLIEVHQFADASEKSFGACAYMRYKSYSDQDEVTCSFLAAKTRVSPLKPALTIPRLELQGAVLAVRLWLSLKEELIVPVQRIQFWTDSNTVLQYLNNSNKRFKPFVANRIAEIHDSTKPQQWRHVPSDINPADHCTRGLQAKQHTETHPWLRGPEFLWKSEDTWPKLSNPVDMLSDDLEVKKSMFKTTRNASSEINLNQRHLTQPQITNLLNPADYSTWQRLCRISAWVLRAARNFLSKLRHLDLKPVTDESLTVSECEEALLAWVQEAQKDAFQDEIYCAQSGNEISPKSSLITLSPFYDGRHLRVGGRLRKATIPREAKYQLLLPDYHPITQLLMNKTHKENAHCGTELIIATVRQRFWPLHARKLAKRAVRSCQECRKRSVNPVAPKMADLPSCRVSLTDGVFSHTGVDYFGPIVVKFKRSTMKRWGCLFTCLSVRAVHIELADSLETDDFLLALRNFIGRRGNPQHLYSDNGTNFHGADNELRQCLHNLKQAKISDFLCVRGIQWHFNPPLSPHFGGAWERLVRSVKTALTCVLKGTLVHESVLRTSLIEVEAMLNSRPLTYNSANPNDFTALTPNHFLLGRSNPFQPVDVFQDKEMCSRKRWRQAQVLADHLNRRWMREYLPNLTVRHRWRVGGCRISVGDLVLIVDDYKPRGQWEMGRIIDILPGDDGEVRAVRVKTPKGEYTRPAVKVCVLE
ncbi:uncharacterized protein LOC124146421 [Haliotis rufescens]|uniref:uncharacterized protein LOC124146421 n=1 Tax=Haliotis rufescens TaxID=6454 RepID=UPI00201F59CA|nr:uncharacterized protein LOC124146421 [Haliotis rufescens]